MAYIASPLEEEKEKEVLEGTEGEGVKQLTQTEDLMSAEGVQDTSQLGKGPVVAGEMGGQQVSTQQKYLEANKAKAQELARRTAGVITGDIDTATSSLTEAGEQYKRDVAAGTVSLDQPLYGEASRYLVDQTYQAPAQVSVPGEQPLEAPLPQGTLESFMADEERKKAFGAQYGAKYGGPRDIQSQQYYVEAKREADKAARTAKLIEDMTGRQELIARTYDRPSGRFSAGTLALDEALLVGSDEAYQQLLAASDTGLGLEGQITGLGEMSEEEYLAGVGTTEATREAMRKQFNLSGEEQEIRDLSTSIKSQAKTDYEDYLEYIQDTYGVQEGVTATSYYDRPQDYVNIQAQNVASAEDYARMKALEELTGSISTLTPFEEQAGRYKEYIDPSQDFRREDFESKVSSERTARLAREEAERKRLAAIAAAEQAAARAAAERAAAQQRSYLASIAGFAMGGGGGAVTSFIGSVFCMAPDTKLLMVDGTEKQLKDLQLGDIAQEGGKIYSISRHLNDAVMFDYEGVLVTGSHAVKENGIWRRIVNTEKAVESDTKCNEVISLSNENHIMICNNVVFADYQEVDNDEGLTDIQSLHILNNGA